MGYIMLDLGEVLCNDIRTRQCNHRFIYDRKDGRKTAFLHFDDGMEIWEMYFGSIESWQLMLRIIARNEG